MSVYCCLVGQGEVAKSGGGKFSVYCCSLLVFPQRTMKTMQQFRSLFPLRKNSRILTCADLRIAGRSSLRRISLAILSTPSGRRLRAGPDQCEGTTSAGDRAVPRHEPVGPLTVSYKGLPHSLLLVFFNCHKYRRTEILLILMSNAKQLTDGGEA